MKNDLQRGPTEPRSAQRTNGLKKNPLVLLTAGVAVLLLGWWVLGRFISEEDRVRETIAAAAQGFRDRHPGHIVDTLSDDFQAFEHLGKPEVQQVLAAKLLFGYRRIQVSLTPSTVPVTLDAQDPKKARADFRATITGQTDDGAPWEELSRQAGGTHLRCEFQKTEQGWKFYRVLLNKD